MELIDNPFDYRYGRHLTIEIEIDRKGDFSSVTDMGGEGMDDGALRDWIQWGEGHEHKEQDIGQYHVGGKSAAIYLAESMEVVCRKAGADTAWRFHDPHWGSRATPLTTTVDPVTDLSKILSGLSPSPGQGFVQVMLRGLKPHRYEVEILRRRLADTYRTLLERDECTIRVNGEGLTVDEMPWAHSIDQVSFGPQQLAGGMRISGRIGAIDRDRLPSGRGYRFEHGIRTEHNGRRITSGEEFGHNLSGRGALMRLYGEVSIRGGNLRPNQLKTGWPKDSDDWQVLEVAMHEHMRSVVQQLNESADAKPVSRQERKRANNARRRVEHALKRLRQLDALAHAGSIPATVGQGGRRPPTTRPKADPRNPAERHRNPVSNRTPPPTNPVGRLLRRIGGMPRVRLDGLGDQSARTEWRQEEHDRVVVINTDYPLYESLGTNEDYVFESLVMHVLNEDEELQPMEARALFDQIVWLDRSAEGEEGDEAESIQ